MSETKKSFEFVENEHNTIIRTTGITETYNGNKNAYDILVGKNIPKGESIVNYCYNQFEEALTNVLSANNIPTNSFCSGTCVAMILAISRGDSSIKPEDVALWDNTNEKNWDNGLKDWEQEADLSGDGGQIYDNRYKGGNDEWKYKSLDRDEEGRTKDLESDEAYLKDIKIFLSAGLPVIIDVGGHYVVVVGVESDVELEGATFEQLVIFDPGAYRTNMENEKYKIVTLGESVKKYNHASYRLLTPFPVIKNSEFEKINTDTEFYPNICYPDPLDDEWLFVKDENGEKTHDPYYLDPVRRDKSIIPAKQGRPLKVAIEAVKNSTMSDEEKTERINELMGAFAERKYKELVVFRNGEYAPRDDEDIIAYDKVTVCLPMSTLTVHENGTYCAGERELEGYDKVIVNVPDRSDEVERYKKLWLMAIGGGEKIETDIPKPGDPENPDNPGGGGNYVFDSAVDVGGLEELKEYAKLQMDVKEIDIVEINGGLAMHIGEIYNGNRTDVRLTVTNLKNGMSTSGDSCFYNQLNIRNAGWKYRGIAIHNGMVTAYIESGRTMYTIDTWLNAIDFHAPANWNWHFILI